jgi:SRSO17 transposase
VESTPKALWDQEALKTKLRRILNEQNIRSEIIDLRGLNVKGKYTLGCIRQSREVTLQINDVASPTDVH